MGNIVSLVRTVDSAQGLKESVSKALDLIGFQVDKNVKSVVIKPNLAYYWDSSTGYTTDPRVVAAIIDWTRGMFGEKEWATL